MPGKQAEQREDQEQDGQDQDPGVPPRHLLQPLPQPAGHGPPVPAEFSLHRVPAHTAGDRMPPTRSDGFGHRQGTHLRVSRDAGFPNPFCDTI